MDFQIPASILEAFTNIWEDNKQLQLYVTCMGTLPESNYKTPWMAWSCNMWLQPTINANETQILVQKGNPGPEGTFFTISTMSSMSWAATLLFWIWIMYGHVASQNWMTNHHSGFILRTGPRFMAGFSQWFMMQQKIIWCMSYEVCIMRSHKSKWHLVLLPCTDSSNQDEN